MRRVVLEELLHQLSRIVDERNLVMVGSQTVHAITDDAPVEVVMSRECDFLLDESDRGAARPHARRCGGRP
jgi:hypothetical protein